MEKLFLVTIFLVLFSSNGCKACFSHNETHDLGPMKSGTPFYRECYCDDSATPGSTAKHLKWLDINDQEIGPMGPGTQPKVYTEQSKYSVSLHIPSLSTASSGKYKCVMEHDDGRRFAYTYEVDVYDPLYFYNTEQVQYIIKGRNSLISCEARGKTPPLISWNKGDDMVNWNIEQGELTEITDDEKYEIIREGVVVKNVTIEDEGIYKCTATVFETGEDVDRYIKVQVLTPPSIQDIIAIPDSNVIVGSSLSLECIAEGFPLPKYSWNKIPKPIHGQNNTRVQEMNKITFESVHPDDRGIYECIAQNQAGVSKKEFFVDVFIPPEITQFYNVTAAEDSTEQIVCRASGRPAPSVSITFETDSMEDDPSVTWSLRNISDSETELNLTFNKVHRSHAGIYFCNASNEVDIAFAEMHLSVLYKPYFYKTYESLWAWEENPINLTCDYDSQPPAKVEWSFQGSHNDIPTLYQNEVNRILITKVNKLSNKKSDRNLYLKVTDLSQFGLYQCLAKNDLGEAKKLFDVKEGVTPMRVNNITITDIKATSATFLITSPVNAGPPIIGYFAEYDEAENYNITNIHLNRTWAVSKEYKLDKLKPSATYFIKFSAINKVGNGLFSKMIEFQTPEKSIPEPPTLDYDSNATQTASNRNYVLKLKAPEDNGDPIDYYVVKYCPVPSVGDEFEENTCKEYNVAPTTELQLSDLIDNTTYYLQLVAHNSEGNSLPMEIYFTVPTIDSPASEEPALSAGAIVGIAVVMVILGILLLDVLLFLTKRQGMIANCCCKKSKKQKETSILARDKKGLLKDNGESVANDTLKRSDNGHKEFEYNKATGIITGKHSAV